MNDELLLEMIKSNQATCDHIYTKIERNEGLYSSKDVQDYLLDCDLVLSFNKLVDINQKAIDRLHPDRNNKFPPVYLKVQDLEIKFMDGMDHYFYSIDDYRQDAHEYVHGKVFANE